MNKHYVKNMLPFLLVAGALGLLLAGLAWTISRPGEPVGASIVTLPPQFDADGFAQAIEPWQWEFPSDHGPHPAFQTEWWYYTGNVTTETGRRFGYQFTIFRRALTPSPRIAQSEWYSSQIYMAHFTVSDVTGGGFYQEERFSRDGAGLAGAEVRPRYRVWLEDWSVQASDSSAGQMRIRARADDFAIELTLTSTKPPALHGDSGLSRKGPEPGNASYYYSLTRLATTGMVAIGDEVFAVSGTSWMDREFGSSALSANAVGWDWFAVHLDDGRDLMVGQIRRQDGSVEPVFGGLLVYPDGKTHYLPSEAFTISPTRTWQSERSGATYPAGWEITVNLDESTLRLILEPLMAEQEVRGSVTYWEGAVRASGDVSGFGYAELTGYAQPLRGLF